MSLAKFLSLLAKSSIYFCQALRHRNDDPFEGTLSRPNLMFHQQMENPAFARQFFQMGPDETLPPNYLDVFSSNRQKQLSDIFASTTYVNCWNISEHESAFLWSMYSSPSDGIGIRSTVARLKKSIEIEKRNIYVGPVLYMDFNSEPIPQDNTFNVFFRKRKSFEAERELRACFMETVDGVGFSERAMSANPPGHYVSCDIHALVDHLFVSPSAPQWYADAVSDVAEKFGAKFPVRKSSISDPAIF
jgi:hypothetical protein